VAGRARHARWREKRPQLRDGVPGHFFGDISSLLEIATMDQRDQELLEKQLRAINPAPRQDGVIIVTLLVGFLAGMTLGGFLVGHTSEPMRVASNDVAPTAYPSIGFAHQLR
jgi:hypothetical protein